MGKADDRSLPYLVLVLVAALVAAAALYLYISERPPGDASPEAGFARDMAVHHAQAVEMSSIVAGRTEDEEVRLLASDIALTQQAQIGQMQGWLAGWRLSQTGTEPQMAWMGHEMQAGERMSGMATQEEVNALAELPPEEMDTEFLRLMVTHHSSAIPMANAALDRTDRTEVETLANAVIASQQSEIEVMQTMLRGRGEEPAPVEDDMSGMDM